MLLRENKIQVCTDDLTWALKLISFYVFLKWQRNCVSQKSHSPLITVRWLWHLTSSCNDKQTIFRVRSPLCIWLPNASVMIIQERLYLNANTSRRLNYNCKGKYKQRWTVLERDVKEKLNSVNIVLLKRLKCERTIMREQSRMVLNSIVQDGQSYIILVQSPNNGIGLLQTNYIIEQLLGIVFKPLKRNPAPVIVGI